MKIKAIVTLILIICASFTIKAQIVNPDLDTTLANKLGADEYGMKMYVFVLLTKGENQSTDKAFIDSCFRGHMTNIGRLVENNQLIVAGPFGKNESNFRGLFVLNVKTLEEANQLLETDPAIKANLLKAEPYLWYGSAALSEYLAAHNKIWKTKP